MPQPGSVQKLYFLNWETSTAIDAAFEFATSTILCVKTDFIYLTSRLFFTIDQKCYESMHTLVVLAAFRLSPVPNSKSYLIKLCIQLARVGYTFVMEPQIALSLPKAPSL